MGLHLLKKPCRIWAGAKHVIKGYGMRRLQGVKTAYVHRQEYEKAYGPVPENWDVHHLCENKACYELTHLEAVTKTIHKRRHAARTHCSKGHEFTPENTYKPKDGWRACKMCHREYQRKRWQHQHPDQKRKRLS